MFEVLQLQTQNGAKRFTCLWGQLVFHVPPRQCTSTPNLQNGWVFGSQDAWFHVPMLLSADTINIFHSRTRLSLPLKQSSKVATDSTIWDKQACTHDTLWRQYYVTTSKEYLINCHILLQYFELVFLQIQMVQILCRHKLIIIWVNYEKMSAFYETPCIYMVCMVTWEICNHTVITVLFERITVWYRLDVVWRVCL